jgi:hypothetical protein
MSNTENKQGRLKGAQKNPIAHKMRQSSTNVVDVPGQKSEEFNRLASEVEETTLHQQQTLDMSQVQHI